MIVPDLPSPDDIKLIAFDLDGTLFGHDRQISDRTAATLARVSELGIRLIIASGRSQTSIIPRTGNVPFIQWAVCSNGATLFDLKAMTAAQVWIIDEAHLAEMISRFEATLPDIVWAWEDTTGHHWTEAFMTSGLHDAIRGNIVADHERPSADALKILIGHERLHRYDLLDVLADVVPHGLGISTSGAEFVEVTASGVNKGAGVAGLCQRLAIDAANVAAFGDNVNDLEMMDWVGHSFAMANAHPSVIEVSDHQTEMSHDFDGVANTLEQLFNLS